MIQLLNALTYTVTRYTPSVAYVNGLPAQGAATSLEIRASIQPMRGDELQRAPEGLRAVHGIKLYAGRELVLRTVEAVGPQADRVTYKGREYQVHRVLDYDDGAPIPSVKYEAYASETGRPISVTT
jgi:hypothetical protein